jgi:hypothetical protein
LACAGKRKSSSCILLYLMMQVLLKVNL